MLNKLIALGSASLALGILLGAFGAHALRDMLDARSKEIYQTGIFYHQLQSVGIIIVALLASHEIISLRAAKIITAMLVTGILLFSGSLYTLAITGNRMFGAITPIGGILFIAAWITVTILACRGSKVS